ncbi:MAG: galactokinase [Anaerolineaceae bacterium]
MLNPGNPRDLVLSAMPEATLLISAPGRVNLIGEHVDYNMGIVLPVAVDRRTWLAVKPLKKPLLRITALDLGEDIEIDLKNLDARVDIENRPLPVWSCYPAAIAWILRSKGYPVSGLEVCIASNLPMRAGLSSSAAIEVAFALAFLTAAEIKMERMQLAQLCQAAETSFIGVHCGLMDQFAVSHGVARHALFFDTRSLVWQPIALPPETVLVVADSGKKRELAKSAYNQRQQECEQAVELLNRQNPTIHSLRDVDFNTFKKFAHSLPHPLANRVRHVMEENDRVQRSAVMLANDDAAGFGQIMFEGHRSLRDLYEVSCDELDFLVEIAAKLPGCLGARLTGAGFGGCTVNLVRKADAEQFCQQLQAEYLSQFSMELKTYRCQADRGAYVEKIEKAVV